MSAAFVHGVQFDVEQFHRALDIPVGESAAIRRPELRADLIREEARETVEAIEMGDLIAAIDGLCDLLCVTYGAAVEFGVNLAPFWNEVHRTNLAKAGGPMRADGKRLKPDGWTPPDIAGVLANETANSAYRSALRCGERESDQLRDLGDAALGISGAAVALRVEKYDDFADHTTKPEQP